MKRFALKISNLVLIAMVIVGTYSCKQDKGKLKFTLTIVADDDVRVANCVVRLYAPVDNSYIDWYDFTNEDGVIEYTFNDPVVVEIIANKGSFIGCTAVQINNPEQSKTLEILPYGSDNNGCPTSSP